MQSSSTVLINRIDQIKSTFLVEYDFYRDLKAKRLYEIRDSSLRELTQVLSNREANPFRLK